ncbi:hypothetical protein N0V84_011978 [Fusarium piperis]|uniref:Uncharacterized protein n=1 Tax=Fusarium piperis TaxID=1435070 RepID=A0A9W8TB34_9HYPO|nr:hypothetical protein N0V84_011978 [Fusarium piperis]
MAPIRHLALYLGVLLPITLAAPTGPAATKGKAGIVPPSKYETTAPYHDIITGAGSQLGENQATPEGGADGSKGIPNGVTPPDDITNRDSPGHLITIKPTATGEGYATNTSLAGVRPGADGGSDEPQWPAAKRAIFARAPRPAYFGDCAYPKDKWLGKEPQFPGFPDAKALVNAEKRANRNTKINKEYNSRVQKWFRRKEETSTSLTGWGRVKQQNGWEQVKVIFEDTTNPKTGKVEQTTKALVGDYTVDHVWELKFFNDYFETRLLPGKRHPQGQKAPLTCKEFWEIFDQSTMQSLLEQAPGPDHGDFMAMEKSLNVLKGKIFQVGELKHQKFIEGFRQPKSGDPIVETIKTLENVGIVVDIFKQKEVKDLFMSTNRRIYNKLREIETKKPGAAKFKLADTYRRFMGDRLKIGADEAWEFVQTWTKKLDVEIEKSASADKQKMKQRLNAFKGSDYNKQGHYESFKGHGNLDGASTSG